MSVQVVFVGQEWPTYGGMDALLLWRAWRCFGGDVTFHFDAVWHIVRS
ncbi:hypothetical protein LOC71_23615 [Rhodopirellula sp. JC740]|uniref:Uncharacterized protein n=1 Tax=Rhodopirellula halodulae TaxID=2894198 RepID=A0ABS8NNX0_9BACT|nr:hypothetical protein [Rhodopirellula sp. JC740]MCC9645278.1 hypothetical protein [Rhodopirellula sp. JC740]